MTRLPALLAESAYQGYSYAYPHKTAYRPLWPPIPLGELWSGERRQTRTRQPVSRARPPAPAQPGR